MQQEEQEEEEESRRRKRRGVSNTVKEMGAVRDRTMLFQEQKSLANT
jgi:hypothetical protein